jgi:N-sulfoglucosamine sulfohydrolase
VFFCGVSVNGCMGRFREENFMMGNILASNRVEASLAWRKPRALWLGLLILSQAASILAADKPRPNILLLVAEDMSSRVGAFGDTVAVTPNIDRLAQEGVRYNNVFATAGVCAPSRAAIITGVSQVEIGAQHMRTSSYIQSPYRSVPAANIKAFPELLRAEGYYTYTDRKLDYQFSGTGSSSGPFTVWSDEGSDTHWRNREAREPFFGMVNFMVTHESGLFPRPDWSAKLPLLGLQLLHSYYQWGEPEVVKAEDVELPPYYPDTALIRQDMARHYNNIHIMDKQVGAIIQQLKDDGLDDNTIVIWTTDHGDGLPRSKREVYDSGIKVPMIIRWPQQYKPEAVEVGALDHRLVSFLDLAPTIMGLAGVESPDYMQGNIFAGAHKDEEPEYIYAAKDRMIEVEDRQRAVRDKRFKYIRNYYPQNPGAEPLSFRDNQVVMQELWRYHRAGQLEGVQKNWFEPRAEEELYDTDKDPHEVRNLASDPRYAHELKRLQAALNHWQDTTRDQGKIAEAEMAQAYWPNGIQPETLVPLVVYNKKRSQLTIEPQTEGGSIGYRVNQGRWQVYRDGVAIAPQDVVEVKSVRYGWKESETIVWPAEE